jgi:tetratricopeptide (TPR) repeat protein
LAVLLTAYDRGDIESMLKAAEKGHRLAPEDPVLANNYAAALLLLRQRPAEAIEITRRNFSRAPGDLGVRINHSLALLQNERVEEAGELLSGINLKTLSGFEYSTVQFARFEYFLKRGERSEALAAYREIRPYHLKPPQARWLEAAYQSVQPKPAAPASPVKR